MRLSGRGGAGLVIVRYVVLAVLALATFGTVSRAAEEAALLQVIPLNGAPVEMRLAQLDALPQVDIHTRTIWTEGELHFRGPTLKRVLAEAGISSGALRLSALNDYVIDLEFSGIGENWPIIATRVNGQTFGVRDNGPLWLIYPYDQGGVLASDEVYASSVWQLLTIEAKGP